MQITEMKQGIPCWFELSSTDPEQSYAFYHGLFGWSKMDMDLGPMGTYSFLNNANGCIGAMCNMQPEQQTQGIPSNWGVYFDVHDCDAATAKARQLGGNVLMPPMDVSEHGRMSVIADPTGAVFSLWQSKSDAGQFVMFEDQSIGWVELATRDTQRAREFYADLLGWTYTESPIAVPDFGNYIEISVDETRFGGILPMSAEWGDIPPGDIPPGDTPPGDTPLGDTPPHWGIYIMVPDVDASVARAQALGGSNPLPAFDAPGVGRIAMVSDPTGARNYVISLEKK